MRDHSTEAFSHGLLDVWNGEDERGEARGQLLQPAHDGLSKAEIFEALSGVACT